MFALANQSPAEVHHGVRPGTISHFLFLSDTPHNPDAPVHALFSMIQNLRSVVRSSDSDRRSVARFPLGSPNVLLEAD